MAVVGYLYGSFFSKVLNKEIDWLDDSIKVALVSSSYTPLQDTNDYWDDVVSYEIPNGNGYTTGGIALTGKTSEYDAGTNTTTINADDVNWSNATITARYAVIYSDTPVTNTAKALIAYLDFGEDKSSSNGPFSIQWNASGIIEFTIQ